MDKNVKLSVEERKVAPIRVVNLASLQDIKVVKKAMPTRQNRRKSVHQVRPNEDEQIEFIESNTEISNDDDASSATVASSSNSITFHKTTMPNTVKRKKGRETRTNEFLMKRVALLRVCAEYMLDELGISGVSLGENQSLEKLKAQYYERNPTRKHHRFDGKFQT